ncbi:hypothetical protein R2217_000792 [Cronobacter turicensis]|nr:hypothetical protein [Cronobacter turicensis]ELQ6074681.1 hypothetical protein [Cronobacter turicensis]ELQ6183733.1 hypothetical protein [Cronobacter turicensis]ELQ6234679.1 hypothetical protein [Cronobacter turicensis]ELQ6238559.1 hypothetical protein [Cronobacter turicensis]
MKIEQMNPCPFCGQIPVRHDSVSPAGFTWSKEEDQVFHVACMTKNCQPSGVYFPDVVWNANSETQGDLMKVVFESLKEGDLLLLEEKKKNYRLYVMSH